MSRLLEGRHILVVEDEFLTVLEMSDLIEERGGTVVGPVGRLDQALAIVRSERLDGAILDVNLDGEMSLPAADELIAAGVPVVLVTGYSAAMLPERFAGVPKAVKPVTSRAAERIFQEVFATP
jgi:CheY-like chemotaxis protein